MSSNRVVEKQKIRILPTLADIGSSLRPIFKKHRVERVLVFGSYARGTQDQRSDLDMLIVKETNDRFLDRPMEFIEIFRVLQGIPVDLLVYTPEELQRNAERPFVKKILREGVTIYE